ncbi:MAG: GlsB/YeaQ/YmgE family stress response membrane protein [Gemmatimonadetes bacterium]|nr:GlsB/YeaQ/YmgE family stress response membrane protein [Gemmatimonadota bacterium]
MDLLTWIIVGLVAGVLAGLVVGGVGLVGDIVVGIVGAFVGGWLFRQLGVTTPFSGLAGTIFTAFVGAVVLLFLLHALQRRRGGYGRR